MATASMANRNNRQQQQGSSGAGKFKPSNTAATNTNPPPHHRETSNDRQEKYPSLINAMLIVGRPGEERAVMLQEQRRWSIALPRLPPHGQIHPHQLETHGLQRQMNGPPMTHLRICCLLSLHPPLQTRLMGRANRFYCILGVALHLPASSLHLTSNNLRTNLH